MATIEDAIDFVKSRRRLTPVENAAMEIIGKLVLEHARHLEAELFQHREESAELDRQIERLSMKIFAAEWELSQDEMQHAHR